MTKKIYLVQAREYVKTLVDGDIRTIPVEPRSQPELIYEGDSIQEAKAEAASFIHFNPCEYTEQGLSCTVSYWDIEVSVAEYDEELDEYGEFERAEELDATTLTGRALDSIHAFADGIDRVIEEDGL